jgi:hypothetical protein
VVIVYMNKSTGGDDILFWLRALEEGAASIEQVTTFGVRMIGDHLRARNWSASIANSAQVGSLIYAELFPDQPMARLVKKTFDQGKMSRPCDNLIQEHAIERGLASLMVNIEHALGNDAPKRAAGAVLRAIENGGHLPLPEDVKE